MLTEREKYIGIRYATESEVKDFKFVEKLVSTMTDEFFDKFLDVVADVVFNYEPEEAKRAYNRAYYYAKKFGCKVSTFVNWYCMDD